MLHNMPCGVCVCVPNNLVSWYYVTSIDCKPWKTRTLGFNSGLALNWQAVHNTSLTRFLSRQGSWDYDDTWQLDVDCLRAQAGKQIKTSRGNIGCVNHQVWPSNCRMCRIWWTCPTRINYFNANQQWRSLFGVIIFILKICKFRMYVTIGAVVWIRKTNIKIKKMQVTETCFIIMYDYLGKWQLKNTTFYK